MKPDTDDAAQLLQLLQENTTGERFRAAGEIAHFTGLPPHRVKKTLLQMVVGGQMVALKGSQIPWAVPAKRSDATYYATPQYVADKTGQFEQDLADVREEDACSAATLAAYEELAVRHPQEFQALYDAARTAWEATHA